MYSTLPHRTAIAVSGGWDSHPTRLAIAGRILRLGYFSSQPASLLTALCADGERVDLLVIPPDTPSDTADAAMDLAATTSNRVHAQLILETVTANAGTDSDPAMAAQPALR